MRKELASITIHHSLEIKNLPLLNFKTPQFSNLKNSVSRFKKKVKRSSELQVNRLN